MPAPATSRPRSVSYTHLDVYKRQVVDAALAYDAGAWRLALDASNVFNRQTVVCRGDRSNCRYGVDRTVLATVTYRY